MLMHRQHRYQVPGDPFRLILFQYFVHFVSSRRTMMSDENQYKYEISYGKSRVPVYRMYATPLAGVTPVPESSFTGRENILLAAEIDVEVFGENFLPSYTKGDNSMVVATDTMKNFILRQSLAFQGTTLEGLLEHLGHQF